MSLITRRAMLSAFGSGLCTLPLWPRSLQAEAAKLDDVDFLVISDTHLGYRDATDAAKQWTKTADELAKARGDLVLHLGDVVDGGREAQYPVYLETRKRIGKPVYEIPGNHDPHSLFQKYVRREIDCVVEHKWLRFLLLGNARVGSHDGFLSGEQLKWLEEQFRAAEAAKQFVIVGMHVPAHDNKHPDRGWYIQAKEGQTKFYELVKASGRVVALFHGHFHNGLRGWDDRAGVHEIIFPSALYNQDRKLADQKAPGYNLDEFRPGYTAVQIKAGVMTLRYQPIGVDKGAERACKLNV